MSAVLTPPMPALPMPIPPLVAPVPATSPMHGPTSVPTEPRSFRWTCDEFHSATDAGLFEGKWGILIDGEVLQMAAPNPAHNISLGLTEAQLRRAFGTGFWVRNQMGMPFGLSTEPIPDVAVVPGVPRDYPQDPRTALLVVEVSGTSLSYDRGEKANLYAAAGILDYWVVDLVNRQVEVFREPRPEPTVRFGANYTKVPAYLPGHEIAPLAMPTARVPVADLLP